MFRRWLQLLLLAVTPALLTAAKPSQEERISAEANLYQGAKDPLASEDAYEKLSKKDKAYWGKVPAGSLADKLKFFDTPLETTTSVEIKLLGFFEDGQSGVSLSESDFMPYLDKLKSEVRTRVLAAAAEEGPAEDMPLQTEFYFRVTLASHHLSSSLQSAIHHAVDAAAAHDTAGGGELEDEAPVRISYKVVDDILREDFHKSELSYTIYILNPTLSSHPYLYTYDSASSASRGSARGCGGPLWVAPDEYVWIDLNAGPVEYGPHSAGGGGVLKDSLPRVSQFSSVQQKRGLIAELVGLVYSACHHLLAPPLAHRSVRFYKNIVIRVIRISDRVEDPYSQSAPGPKPADELGLAKLQQELGKLQLSSQTVSVTYHDLPMWQSNLASSVYFRALRSHTSNVMWRPPPPKTPHPLGNGTHQEAAPYTLTARTHEYLDSDELMSSIGELSAKLMAEAKVPPVPNTADELHFPVYLFDLATTDLVLIDRHFQVVPKENLVVGVRSRAGESLRDFTCGGKMVFLQPHDVTRPLLGAVMESIWGVAPTHVVTSEATALPLKDYTWSLGPTPFGPFGEGTLTSFVQRDAGMRNVVLAHLNASLSTAQATLAEFARFGLDDRPLPRQLAHELDARWSVFVHKIHRAARTAGLHDFDKALYFALSAAHDVGAMHHILQEGSADVMTVLKCFQEARHGSELYLVALFALGLVFYYARGAGAKQKRF